MMAPVIFVDHFGAASIGAPPPRVVGRERLAETAAACASLLDAAMVPASCGPEIPVAPARGPVEEFTPREMVQTEAGNFVSRHAGYQGRTALRVEDAFDKMTRNARKAHDGLVARAKREGKPAPAGFVPPFTHGQVSAARDYAALSERCAAFGMSCSSLEAVQRGGGGGDREAAIFRDFARLRSLHRRIGSGLAKEVRRHRPSTTGGKRSAIRVRVLVDQVCLGGMTLDEVLEAHGWRSHNDTVRADLRTALCDALDRMQGYRTANPQNVA